MSLVFLSPEEHEEAVRAARLKMEREVHKAVLIFAETLTKEEFVAYMRQVVAQDEKREVLEMDIETGEPNAAYPGDAVIATISEEDLAKVGIKIDWREKCAALQRALDHNLFLSSKVQTEYLRLELALDESKAFSLEIAGKLANAEAERDEYKEALEKERSGINSKATWNARGRLEVLDGIIQSLAEGATVQDQIDWVRARQAIERPAFDALFPAPTIKKPVECSMTRIQKLKESFAILEKHQGQAHVGFEDDRLVISHSREYSLGVEDSARLTELGWHWSRTAIIWFFYGEDNK